MTLFIKKPNSSSEMKIIFMKSFISSFEFINVLTPDPNIFLWIVTSAADAAAVNLNGIKTLLANSLNTFPIKLHPGFSNGPKSLPKNAPDCPILRYWVFDNITLVNELFAKVSRSFKTCVLVNNNFCGRLSLSLEWQRTFNEIFKATQYQLLF